MSATDSIPAASTDRPGHLVELAVTDLGIIEHTRLLFGDGMTALTGETGAGKTLLVGAIDLLLGGRADPAMVRSGASEAVIEGRFAMADDDVVLTRVVPAEGRSRAYVDGRLATAANLAERATELVDLHGQHAHQSLLAARVQRDALDRFAAIDLDPLRTARAERRRLEAALAALGGDTGARAREIDLLRFQLGELDAAAIVSPEEDEELAIEEASLADTVAVRIAASEVSELLGAEGAAADQVGGAVAAVAGHRAFTDVGQRLRAIQSELADVTADVRRIGEETLDQPERIDELRGRRQLLADLRRKYAGAQVASAVGSEASANDDLAGLPGSDGRTAQGTPGARGTGMLADVVAYHAGVGWRLAELETHDATAARLDADMVAAAKVEQQAASVVGRARRAAGPDLARAVEAHLRELAMADARVEVHIGLEDPGDDVTFLLAANPGTEPAPLAKVASGGELARAMLGLRLVLSEAPGVLVFDEVDAGIGGQAALAVGRALAALGLNHQVLVVTHLPQVAAFADHQVTVTKAIQADSGATVATARTLSESERVVELSRMLSGTPESERVRDAASELLAVAARERGR